MNKDLLQWLETAEPGWRSATLPFLALKDTFVSGDDSGRRLLVRYYQCGDEDTLCAKVLCGPAAQGPPGHAHGGGMAAILDETMGGAAWLAGYPVVAAQLNITFVNMLPIGTPAVAFAEVTGVEGRKVLTRARLTDPEGETEYCRSTGLFIALDRDQTERLPKEAASMVAQALARQRRDTSG